MAGPYGALGRKLGTSIGSFFGGGDAEQAGELAGLKQIALQEQIGQTRAHTAALAADAEKKRLEAQAAQPQSIIARTLAGLGVPTEAAPDVQTWLETGSIGKYDTGGLDGPTMPKPDWYAPQMKTQIGRHFAGEQAVQGGGAKSVKDYFEGLGQAELNTRVAKALASGDMTQFALLHNKDPLKAVQALIAEAVRKNEVTPQVGGSQMAATEGKPLFHVDGTGAVLNQYGMPGMPLLDVTNPLAGATITLRKEQAGQAKAGAAENYAQAGAANASADNSRAHAAEARQRTAQGATTGTVQIVTDAAGNVTLVDKRTGLARPAIGPDGKPVAARVPGGAGGAAGGGGKPMPAAALKMQQELLEAIGIAGGINADLGAIDQQLADGKLKLAPASNAIGTARNYVGASTENSRNLATFKATLEKLRNDSLRLNKGVQTEGDAVRAWNELFASINDKDVVQQRLGELQRINRRAAELHRMNIETLRANYGAGPLDTDARFEQPPAVNGGATSKRSGGASGGWDTAPSLPAGWKIEKVK